SWIEMTMIGFTAFTSVLVRPLMGLVQSLSKKSKIKDRQIPIAQTQPYYIDISSGAKSGDIKSFDGRKIMELTPNDLEYFVSLPA
ncbi:hypothetical protein PENTCL1PPCAC_382, partial [Pristionchus entomophagus]